MIDYREMTPKFWKPFIACLVLTPLSVLLSLIPIGMRHEYYLGMALFPFAFYTAFIWQFYAFAPVLWIGQLPAYGMILGLANRRGKILYALCGLLALHLLGIIGLCLALRSIGTLGP